jgi:hypothetical protein
MAIANGAYDSGQHPVDLEDATHAERKTQRSIEHESQISGQARGVDGVQGFILDSEILKPAQAMMPHIRR